MGQVDHKVVCIEVPGTVPTYIVVQIAIHDSAKYAHYMALAPASIAATSATCGAGISHGGPSTRVVELARVRAGEGRAAAVRAHGDAADRGDCASDGCRLAR